MNNLITVKQTVSGRARLGPGQDGTRLGMANLSVTLPSPSGFLCTQRPWVRVRRELRGHVACPAVSAWRSSHPGAPGRAGLAKDHETGRSSLGVVESHKYKLSPLDTN